MSRYLVSATWDDAPHLTPERRDSLWASIPPYQRDARTRGLPQLGAGVIFPVAEEDIKVAPFPIPAAWACGYALDVGWQRTAAVWGAQNPQTQVVYLWSAHYQGDEQPSTHAAAIKARRCLEGRIDPAARGRKQDDGLRLMTLYEQEGLRLTIANNGVESGLNTLWQLYTRGLLKVFDTPEFEPWFSEYRVYRRNEKGEVVKEHDHLMDATRYLMADGLAGCTRWLPLVDPPKFALAGEPETDGLGYGSGGGSETAWMA